MVNDFSDNSCGSVAADRGSTNIGLARGTVRIAPYSDEWTTLFEYEGTLLRAVMNDAARHIEHIGSTAIGGMSAKPIIDLVVIVSALDEATVWIPTLESLGYEYRDNTGVPDRIFFAKGPRSRRTNHLSLTEMNSKFYKEKLLFRDYLRTHSDAFDEYLRLKEQLALRHANDRERYTSGKRKFVERILSLASGADSHTLLIFTLLFVLLCFPNIASAFQDNDTAAIDAFIARQAKRERGEEYPDARKVLTGDLTHDGQPETVVLYTIEGQGGSNLHIQYLAVFVRRKGKLSLLTHADVGGKSTRGVELTSIENNSILLGTLNYGPKDASCCPSVKGTTRYVLSGGRLLEQRRRKPPR